MRIVLLRNLLHGLAWHYNKIMFCLQSLEEEEKMTPEQLAIKNVGKQVHLLFGF